MVIRRSFSEMKPESALSMVVLPEPVPPEMMVVMRAFTAAASTSAIGGRSAPTSTSLLRLNGFLENLRIDTSGPSTPIGRTATLTREPSCRRASQSGCDSSTRRPTADDDFVDDAQQMLLVLEAHRQRLEHAAALDVDAFMTVDQDVADARVLEQRLERTQAGHFVENFRDEIGEFLRVERQPLDQHVLRDQLLDVVADFVLRQLFQRRKIDFLDQPAMQAHLGVEQLVAEQRIGGGCCPRGGGSAGASGNTVQATPSSADGAAPRPPAGPARQRVGL